MVSNTWEPLNCVDCKPFIHSFSLSLSLGSYQIYSVYPPNYNKNITDPNRVNNSFYTPDNKLGLTLENQNHSLPNLNQTQVISNNQTLRMLIQTLALSNTHSKTNREHLNAPQGHVMAVVPYCDRTLYLLAFWTTTLVYALAGNALVITICVCCFMKVLVKLVEYVFWTELDMISFQRLLNITLGFAATNFTVVCSVYMWEKNIFCSYIRQSVLSDMMNMMLHVHYLN